MVIRPPHSQSKLSFASAPKARGARARKSAHLSDLLATSLGQFGPGHWPGHPGPFRDQPMPIPCPSGPSELGPPLDITQAARLIGCSPWTVRQTLIPRGLPFFRLGASGKLIFYSDQIVRWIENQQEGGITTK